MFLHFIAAARQYIECFIGNTESQEESTFLGDFAPISEQFVVFRISEPLEYHNLPSMSDELLSTA